MEVKDNFLSNAHLTQLNELIDSYSFPWFFQKEQVEEKNDGYFFSHILYDPNLEKSIFFDPVFNIFNSYLKYSFLCRCIVNLIPRQSTPSISIFHTDFQHNVLKPDEDKITTAIFYLNTNNGYTEFKGRDRIDCVENRLVMFPAKTFHRAVGQTDVIQRIVLNFNFIL